MAAGGGLILLFYASFLLGGGSGPSGDGGIGALFWTARTAAGEKAESEEVTCGSAIKLQHERTKFRLHSHEVQYGSGSGQQSVTGFQGGDDANSYWVVRGTEKAPCAQGSVTKHGDVIRLQHMRTRKWLHSHLHSSPLTNNFEVSCFGGDSSTDTGDNWKVELESGKGDWRRDQKVRFFHVDTGAYLHSHDKKYSHPIKGQQEVCGVRKKSADNVWLATEGVYFPAKTQG
ncbi:hypothetical protein CBR_g38858 [Chara braunii]|uniref:MIR domain-containing protein n=1 Tax=Chara braunii TaxID=69332 RepID=A0A388LQI7_CHABU|nr:hypothetical protein CBR_g38858 [Chara braunii]|eukprot:GBG84577.1 hypothetical protein CBR_g38858 [Chara braunii]